MTLTLAFDWEEASGAKTLSNPGKSRAAEHFADEPAQLTARQAAFYRNLIRLAEQVGSRTLPISFITKDGSAKRMDHGCMKIAVHAKFIEQLSDAANGVVETITLKWDVLPGTN
jgi:hypothetical protein